MSLGSRLMKRVVRGLTARLSVETFQAAREACSPMATTRLMMRTLRLCRAAMPSRSSALDGDAKREGRWGAGVWATTNHSFMKK